MSDSNYLDTAYEVLKEQLEKDLKASLTAVLKEEIKLATIEAVCRALDIPLTVKQVAHITGESEDTIYKWHQRNRLSFTKVGGRLSISLKEINNNVLNSDSSDK